MWYHFFRASKENFKLSSNRMFLVEHSHLREHLEADPDAYTHACTLSPDSWFQSYPTLCHPADCNPPASSVHGISQARIMEWVAIFFSSNIPNPAIEPVSPAWQANSLPLSHLRRRRRRQLTPALLPGKPQGWRSLVGCSPWGRNTQQTLT